MKKESINRLIYRSWHRGTKELDLILGKYINANVNSLKLSDIDNYELLLQSEDPDIFRWIVKRDNPPNENLNNIVLKIRNYLEANSIDEYK